MCHQGEIETVLFVAELESMNRYSVKQVYEKLAGVKPRVHWDRMVWNRLITPKHRFICWLAVQCRLQTTTKLARIGISQSSLYMICGLENEDHQHLFFQCHCSCQIIQAVQNWLGLLMNGNLNQLVRKTGQCRASKFRKQVILAAIGTAVYLIW
ncbi:uncharacterized protein [Spinacia oleracea]|uniref:Reverse transcriptase zinc-binding domain-containing protein n=1 Tax=Spinacia oleracea TaxID=3562 RepID=A0A9R0IY73_SPIOL|nr:uncharacterized protein LOC110796773 [Spinacia oleracea]